MKSVQPRDSAPSAHISPARPLPASHPSQHPQAPEASQSVSRADTAASKAITQPLPTVSRPTRLERLRSKLRALWFNTLNTLVFLLSGGSTTLHEGRYSRQRGVWRNWSGVVSVQPRRYEAPETEAEVCRIVRESTRLRAVGGGHTFNDSTRTEQTLLSLDRYNRVLAVDTAERRVRVQAGIRLRELNKVLARHGLALPVLGSTDSQSLAGLIATDLHGTGREHGFLSEQVLSLRIVNARGEAETFLPGSDVFHAAIGAIGTCGVVTEVELRCVPAYHLEKSIWVIKRSEVDRDLERLLRMHSHVSFYYLGGVDVEHVRMNVWDHTGTDTPLSKLQRLRKMVGELSDMIFSGYLLGFSRCREQNRFLAALGLRFNKLTMHARRSVYPASTGFGRKLFFWHDEIEYGVPHEHFRQCLKEVQELLKRRGLFAMVEVRFTPDKSQALIGPGVGRRTCFIELAPSLAYGEATIASLFHEAEEIFLAYGGQPHLGKATRAVDGQRMFGERFTRFQQARLRQDPDGKFTNAFTDRVLGVPRAEEHLRAAG
ncbi:MAG TPA: D-arabinono-1,4-lactone oxidase [Myxococcaceae bacterium]|nr:D-arabinono-1,4-lactone oxidase [Myxococcaceae bacterium]